MLKSNVPVIFMYLIIMLTACYPKIYPLNMERMPNNSDALKLYGYYYITYGDSNEFVHVYFLYKNGVLLDGFSGALKDLASREKRYASGEYAYFAKNNQSNWGVYKIKDQKIILEKWYSGNRCCKTSFRSGEILDNETFKITRTYSEEEGEYEEVNYTYTFKPFSPKPDSTNFFID